MINCEFCGIQISAQRKTKRFCGQNCAIRFRSNPKVRNCKLCNTEFSVISQADANRRYCSKECSKNSHTKRIRQWNEENLTTEKSRQYRINWLNKNEGYDAARKKKERLEILSALGGCCVVCGVTKTVWLHVDYIPTCVGKKYRHSRGKRFVLDNIRDFRILCANHHYELTLTGAIEGTDITQ